MPRPPRLHIDGGFYHVILRGNHREPIFFSAQDRHRFAELVAEVIERFRMRVHAYCWMTNHIHLAIQVSDVPLGRAMMRIASRYARATQKRQPTTGHLFERRYRAILVDADEYLLELVRYIHLNPVRARMVSAPGDYPWSGHQAYLGKAHTPWLTTEFTLSLFAKELHSARVAYDCFVRAGIGQAPDVQLYTGRSDEPRVLGSDRFLESLQLRCIPHGRMTLDEIMEQTCRDLGLDVVALSAPGRHRSRALARALIAHHALIHRVATLSELARRFDRTVATLSESLERYRRQRPDLFHA